VAKIQRREIDAQLDIVYSDDESYGGANNKEKDSSSNSGNISESYLDEMNEFT